MLTPEDIQSREFLVSLRGYDRDEVHAFLDEVAGDFATLLTAEPGADEGARAAAGSDAPVVVDVAEPEPEPEQEVEPAGMSFAAIGAETQRILEAAQEAAQSIRARAEDEAATVRETRMTETESEVAKLQEQADAISAQIDDLTTRRDELAGRLRQARETVDLALLEIDPEVAEVAVDASSSVLAADDDAAEE